MSVLDEILSNQVLVSAALGWLVAQLVHLQPQVF